MRTAPILVVLVAALLCGVSAGPSGRQAAARLLARSSVAGVVEGIRDGRFSCEDVIREQLRRIQAYNSQLHAFISVNGAQALRLARRKDQAGVLSGPLHCVPVAVKDNIDLRGVPTTNGATALRGMVAPVDSAVVSRILAAGGIVIGKTNMAEMSDSGTKSESAVGGLCANPWDRRRSCLGSSGGSGASVASGLAVIAIGTDTEGSVIGPCSASGLLCLRPTQGGDFEAIKAGVYPAFERQDLLGIMAKTPADYLTAHDAIYGVDYSKTAGRVTCLKGLKIRFLDNFYESFPLGPGITYSPDPELVRLHNLAAQRFSGLGASVERYKGSLQDLGGKFQSIVIATMAKPACSNSCMKRSLDKYFARHAAHRASGSVSPSRFSKTRDLLKVIRGFPASYQSKLNFTLNQADADVCGSAACGAYERARAAITQVLRELFGDANVLAVPYSAKLPQLNTEEPGIADQISAALNPYTGWPSVALPIGFSQSSGAEQPHGMPVSLVLLSKAEYQESLLLGVANAYLASYAEVRTPASTPALPVS